jgi:hypothetical protein
LIAEDAMSNLTISVPSDVLKRTRLRALDEDMSVNAVLAAYLDAYARADEDRRRRERVVARILGLSEQSEPAAARTEYGPEPEAEAHRRIHWRT